MGVKIFEQYLLECGMQVRITPNYISASASNGQKAFVFQNSKIETVEMIAKALLECVAIARKQSKKDFGISTKPKKE